MRSFSRRLVFSRRHFVSSALVKPSSSLQIPDCYSKKSSTSNNSLRVSAEAVPKSFSIRSSSSIRNSDWLCSERFSNGSGFLVLSSAIWVSFSLTSFS